MPVKAASSDMLMASSRKKVIIRTFADLPQSGYLPLAEFVEGSLAEPSVALLDLEGRIVSIPLDTVKSIAYVRDFNLNDTINPEGLLRRTFLARPRTEGLWVRLTLAGGEPLEGLAALDLSLLDGVIKDRGLFLIPPDIRSNAQRLFIPRSAIVDMQVVAVITTPSKSKPAKPAPAASRTQQDLLFPK